MARLTNKIARGIVNDWLTAQGKTPPPDTLDYLSYAHACRRQYGGTYYLDAIDTRQQACKLIREFARIVVQQQDEDRLRALMREIA